MTLLYCGFDDIFPAEQAYICSYYPSIDKTTASRQSYKKKQR